MKKALSLALAAAMAASLAACGGSPAASTASSAATTDTAASGAASAGGQTLKVMLSEEPGEGDAFATTLNKWADETGNTVDIMVIPYDDQLTKFPLMAKNNDLPDLLSTTRLARLYPDEFEDLGKCIDTSIFEPQALQIISQNYLTDKLSVLPQQFTITNVFYNKDAFDACGITDTPKTWDEFLTVCQTLKDNGYEPLALDGAYANFNFYNHLVRHLGEDAIAELGKNGGWADNEAAVTAAQEIIDFVNAGYLAEGAPDAYPASQTKVGLGTAAMIVCANYVTSEVDAAVGEPVNWGFFNYPEVEGNVDASAYAGANSLAISSNCENPQAAFDFIMTIVTGTCGQELVDNGGQIPADTRLKESVLAGSVETLKNTTTPMSWCGSLNTLDGWSSIKSSMIELFEGKYATGADYCAYLDTLCG